MHEDEKTILGASQPGARGVQGELDAGDGLEGPAGVSARTAGENSEAPVEGPVVALDGQLETPADLPEAVARVLLFGEVGLRARERADPATARTTTAILKSGSRALAALWREHEPELRRYAAAHGLKPAYGSRRYFAEAIAARLAAHDAAQLARLDASTAVAVRAVAAHEAAHGIVWLLGGIPVARVAIFENGGGLAVATDDADAAAEIVALAADGAPQELDDRPRRLLPDWNVSAFALGVAAGIAAYERASGRPDEARERGWNDRLRLQNVIGGALNFPPYCGLVVEIAELYLKYGAELVAIHGTWIDVVALELLRSRSLSGAEILALKPTRSNERIRA